MRPFPIRILNQPLESSLKTTPPSKAFWLPSFTSHLDPISLFLYASCVESLSNLDQLSLNTIPSNPPSSYPTSFPPSYSSSLPSSSPYFSPFPTLPPSPLSLPPFLSLLPTLPHSPSFPPSPFPSPLFLPPTHPSSLFLLPLSLSLILFQDGQEMDSVHLLHVSLELSTWHLSLPWGSHHPSDAFTWWPFVWDLFQKQIRHLH